MRKPILAKRPLFVLCAGAIASLTASCGAPDGPAISDADRQTAEKQHPQLLAQFGGSYDGKQAKYVAGIGEKLATAAGIGGRCHFTLVNTDVVNAFAVPGCYIYVTRGLLGLVNSEDELASVLAHEIGHITANHSGAQQRQSVLSQIGVLAVEAITGSDRLAKIAGAAAGLNSLRYSREHEYEADDLGLTYLRKAGYDPYAAPDMLGLLQRNQDYQAGARGKESGAKSIPEWALTHPLTQNRVERALKAAEHTGEERGAIPEKGAEYLREIDGLLYGDDPVQGFVLGRSFAHPEMRIAFEAPPGFTLTNSPQAVLIEGPDGTRGEFGGARLPEGGPEAYARGLLRAVLGDAPVEIAGTQRFVSHGTAAYRLRAAVQTRQGAVPISLAIYAGQNGNAFHILIFSRPGSEPPAALDSLFSSFRNLNPQEIAQLRPRVIQVARVGQGDTLRSLATRMAADRPAELLSALNGLGPNGSLPANGLVKLVVYPQR